MIPEWGMATPALLTYCIHSCAPSLLRSDSRDKILLTSLPCISSCLYYLFCIHGLEMRPLTPLTRYRVLSCIHGLLFILCIWIGDAPLCPLDSLPRPILCTWIGVVASSSLDSLPRPIHYTLYYHIHVSLFVIAICLMYID